MVAGHAISRPRIQLARMDLSSMTAVQDQVRNEDNDNLIEEEEMFINSQEDNHEVEDIEEEIPATPPHQQPTRNLFDLTNIREESTLMDDSVLDSMEETIISPNPNMEAVQEENAEDDLDDDHITVPILDPIPSTSQTRRLTSTQTRVSVRQSLQPPPGLSSSQSPILSLLPNTSPYVLEAETTPVGLPRASNSSRPSSIRIPSPNQSASLTESFLEQLVDVDPLEGPSWLFASVKKKKRRSSAVKKLSCIMSDLDNTDNNSALDNSDIDPSSREPSGQFVLDRDLRQSLVVEHSNNPAILSPDIVEDGDSNQENVPVNEDIENAANISGTRDLATPRTPLSSLGTCLDEGGNSINLKEARIMLNNVGVDGQNSSRNVLSPSPVLMTRKNTLTLDELFSFGIRDDITPKLKRKYGSDSQVGESQPKPLKKARNTEVPQSANVRLQNLEVRLEKNICQADKPEEDPTVVETGGRSRRQKSAVSYKEPSLGKKMRQVCSFKFFVLHILQMSTCFI